MGDVAPIKVTFDVDTRGLKAAQTAAKNLGKSISSTLGSAGGGLGPSLLTGITKAGSGIKANIASVGSSITKSLGSAGVNAGKAFGNSLVSSVKGMAIGGTVVAAVGIGAAVKGLGSSVTAASDLNETISKTGQVFGQEALPGLEKWAGTAATAFGQSKQQALDAASTFAVFGKGAGLSGENLNGFSTKLTELSSDLASFNNTSPEEAITAIGAALRGESEPIRRFGVLLDDATLKSRAMSMGISDGTTTLTQQQRVLAAQAEILAQTTTAQGDYARTADGLANLKRSVNAQVADVKAQVGQAALPIATDIMKAFSAVLPQIQAALVPAVTTLATAFQGILPSLMQMLPGLIQFGAAVLPQIASNMAAVLPVIGQLMTTLGPIFGQIIGMLMSSLSGVMPMLMDLIAQIGPVLMTTLATLLPILMNLVSVLGPILGDVLTAVMPIINDLLNLLGPLLTEVINALLPALMPIIELLGTILIPIIQILSPILVFAANLIGQLAKALADFLNGALGGLFSALGLGKVDAPKPGNPGSPSGSTVYNNYNVQAQGLTVGQVQQDATRRSRMNAPVMGY